jgi:hypothetical protein
MRQMRSILALVAVALGGLAVTRAETSPFFPVDEVRPGMVGVGRTVFAGDTLEDFKVTVIGVLKNVMGPRRDLILAKLEGGPLANTGVIAGMSGSPVYIDGRLLGAVSYSIGSFPKEPIAGITPIAEMTDAVNSTSPRPADRTLAVNWPAPASEVFAALGRLERRAVAPLGSGLADLLVSGPASLADLAPALRPIGAAMVMGGFDPDLDRDLREALDVPAGQEANVRAARPADAGATLRAGDPIGMSLIRGDLEMGATGTVTYVDGSRVYAFGHPFLNLGPTSFAMTRARVFTVLPSLESSMKIATLGPVVGTVNQDRATAVGGTLGSGPHELEVHLTLHSDRAAERQFTFYVARDPTITPLFTYVAVLNALTAYERQAGVLSVAAHGTLSFGRDGDVAIDDLFSGDTAGASVAAAVAAPVGAAMTNEFRAVLPEKLDLDLATSEQQQGTTIDRVWLDTVKPHFSQTYQLQVQLQDYRGSKRVVSLPVTMPAHTDGPVTLLVCDATSLSGLEQRDIKPGKPASWSDLLTNLNTARRNNRIYVRLLSATSGAVVGGDTMPALPSSVRSILDADLTVAKVPVLRTVVGSWEQRMDVAVRGSRELTLTLTAP